MIKGFAIVPVTKNMEGRICYTSAPKEIGEGTIYQIYTNLEDAQKFLELDFSDAQYLIIPVLINLM